MALLQFSVLVMVRRVTFRKTRKEAKKICLLSFFSCNYISCFLR